MQMKFLLTLSLARVVTNASNILAVDGAFYIKHHRGKCFYDQDANGFIFSGNFHPREKYTDSDGLPSYLVSTPEGIVVIKREMCYSVANKKKISFNEVFLKSPLVDSFTDNCW